MSTYGWILLSGLFFPFLFSFHNRIVFYRKWKRFFPAAFITGIFFIIWDIWFTRMQVWGFNPRHVGAIRFFHLPLEEVLFFLVIPYCSVFTYEVFGLFILKKRASSFSGYIAFALLIVFASSAIIFSNKLYPLVDFSLASLLMLLVLGKRYTWTGLFFISYLFLLIPFLIINGILTGTFLESPVVWYQESQIIGLRIFTIPVEDFVYGMNLVLMNIFFYELFVQRREVTGIISGEERLKRSIGESQGKRISRI